MTARARTISGLVALMLVATPAAAQRRGAVAASDAQVVAEATLVVSGQLVEIYQHGVHVAPAFLKLAEDAYRRLETLTGRTLDTATLGPKIRIYVSDAIRVSHVWRGYNHPSDPKGIVLLSGRAYEDGLKTTNATYVHEMAHLTTSRSRSFPKPAWVRTRTATIGR